MTTAEHLAHYEDLFGLPNNVVGEIIAGHLYTHPRLAQAHACTGQFDAWQQSGDAFRSGGRRRPLRLVDTRHV
ncbi:MAG: hypothetical protein ACYCUY_00780 [Acidithiobacillus sp.]